MGTGYVRNDTSNSIVDEGVIDAADLDGEFDAIVAAFVNTTGHTHDGTVAEGGAVLVLGPAQDLVADSSAFFPKTDSAYTLGKSGVAFSNTFTDALTLGGSAITSTATELNILDGVTSTAAEINILDGVTSTSTEINLLDGVTATTEELNILDGVTSTATELNLLDGVTSSTSELNILDGVTSSTTEINILDGVTSTTAELNILDGVTATKDEINVLDGITSTVAELNTLDGVTATFTELNLLDGVTSTTSELNILDGVTATYTELNILDGVTATTAELNYVDGVTSNIQTQLGAKAPVANATLTGITTTVDIRSSTGESAVPSFSFTGHTDTGMYLASEFTAFTHNGTAAAFIDANGTSVSSANAIITSEKGDARYLGLSGNASMSGDLNLSDNDILNVSRLELLAGTEGSPSTYFATDTDTGMYFTGTRLAFSNDGSQSAMIEPAGTGLNDDNTIVTREKGDARYLELSGGTLTGGINLGNQIITNLNEIYASSGSTTDPSYTFTSHTDTGIYLSNGFTAFAHDGVASAYIDADGTGLASGNAIVTRGKGDARYLQDVPTTLSAVGTYAFLRLNPTDGQQIQGNTTAGSNLRYGSTDTVTSGSSPSGTWQIMGYIPPALTGDTDSRSLFVRIS